ncbi:MAG: 30S ribosomal protein S12 methylthiotransferase RimO [Lachnospiraceae bacterium]|nr:30S ribosomal protein S12 methylthiotransferase RimO [Lachnospiraceae bacterium]
MFVSSLGCDKNLTDTEHMMGALREAGFTFTEEEAEAESAIVNTCCFIHDAKQESVREILRLAAYRREGRMKALIVTGCLAQRYREEIRKEIPEVDAIVGTASVDRIVKTLSAVHRGKAADVLEDINRSYKMTAGRVLTTGGHYAYLKIAEGCDKHCTYCIIPQLRGRFRSVPVEELLEEAKALDAQGVTELILVAQETTRYGLDLYGEKRLHVLLKRLCEETEGIRWIRLLYCYPEEITDDLIRVIREEEKIVKYLDIPVQSGSDAVLKRMGRRNVTAEGIRETVRKLREEIPGVCLRTTLISGFPGETAADHRDSMELVKDLCFDRLGVFPYSKEEGTAAGRMRGQIAEPLKKRRRTELMKLQQRIAFAKAKEHIGEELSVFVEGMITDEEGEEICVARTFRDAPEVDGFLFFSPKGRMPMSGEIVRVRVTDAREYDLVGEEV